jgi:hypothetical protein
MISSSSLIKTGLVKPNLLMLSASLPDLLLRVSTGVFRVRPQLRHRHSFDDHRAHALIPAYETRFAQWLKSKASSGRMRAQSGSIAGDRIEQLHVNAQAQHMTLVNPRAGAMIRSRHDAPAFD